MRFYQIHKKGKPDGRVEADADLPNIDSYSSLESALMARPEDYGQFEVIEFEKDATPILIQRISFP